MNATSQPNPGSGRVVVITGGGTGIGKEIARAFAELGDRIVLCGRTSTTLDAAAAELRAGGAEVTARTCDIGDPASVDAFVATTVQEAGRIDVLVNNAGIYGPVGPAWENDTDHWLDTIRIDLCGVFLMSKAVVPHMLAAGGGAIINLSGGGATSSKPTYSAYASAKSGVVRFTEVLADELRDKGIQVNGIAPGFIATRFHEETLAAGDGAADLAQVKDKLAKGGDDPRKAAELAVFLASPDAAGITGKLFSAIWDDWRSEELRDALRASRDLYTLRRIDDVMFKEVPRS